MCLDLWVEIRGIDDHIVDRRSILEQLLIIGASAVHRFVVAYLVAHG